jgi:hypothetical protein
LVGIVAAKRARAGRHLAIFELIASQRATLRCFAGCFTVTHQ